MSAPDRPVSPCPPRAPVRLHDLTLAWQGHPAVHHLSGEFASGQLNAVVGPNGAGKSSLLAALAGQPGPQQHGRIDRPARAQVAYLPQATALDRGVPVSVHELVAMGAWARIGSWRALDAPGRQAVAEALAAVGLSGFERRLVGELSVGQLQRALFARVLVQDAALILLDEPFNAIDARTTADLVALLRRWRGEQRTVIAVLHDLDLVRQQFDQALLLAREPVAWGPAAWALSDDHLRQARQMAEAWHDGAEVCHRAA